MRSLLWLPLLAFELSSAALTATNVEIPIANNLAVTTTFTPPAACTSGTLTEMALNPSEIWANYINPVPGSTFSSCYPSQFYSSVIATTSLPPFSALICPYSWGTYNINDTYIICCPEAYDLAAPNINNTERPADGAICYSMIWPSVLIDVCSYDSTAFVSAFGTSAPANGTIAYAYAFDGTAAVPGSITANATATQTTEPNLTSTLQPATSISRSIASPTASKTLSSFVSPTSSGAVRGAFATSIARASIGYWALAYLAWFLVSA